MNGLKKLFFIIKTDYNNNINNRSLFKFLLYDFIYPNYRFRFLFWLRVCEFSRHNGFFSLIYPFAKFFWHKYKLKAQIEMPFYTTGPGCFFKHPCGTIIINARARIGCNCQLSPGVIIGISSIKRKDDCPIIGDNVYLSPNSQIYGKCNIGDNVIICPNTVIIDMDIPSNSFAYGNPVKVRSLLS